MLVPMSAYQVIARKYRPQRFEEVVGQDHVTRTLGHAIQKGRIAHAYLFCGPRGTGKTTLARIFAKCLNCSDGPRTDWPEDDPRCQEIAEGRSLDVMEIDGASNRGIEEIRELRDTVHYAPAVSPYKIFIIDEVHMLTKEAFNALLKTLEEPPPHVKFMFATTEPEKVLPTILSRCQRFDLRRIAAPEIMGQLKKIADKEGIKIEETALQAVARGADGGMRDAQSTLDQLISFCGDHIEESDVLSMFGLTSRDQILRLAEAMIQGNKQTLLSELIDLAQNGKDLGRLLGDLQEYFRHLMLIKVSGDQGALEGLSESELASLQQHAKGLNDHQVLRLLEALSDTDYRLREASAKRIAVEIGLIRASESLQERSIDEVIGALKAIRKQSPADTQPTPNPSAPTSPPPPPAAPKPSGAPAKATTPPPQASPPPPPKPVSAETRAASQPDPAPAHTEEVPQASGDINLHTLWNKLVLHVGRENPFLHSYLADGHPMEVKGKVITVGYPTSQVDQMEMVDNKKNHQAIESYLETLGQPGCKVRFIKSDNLQPKEKQPLPSSPPPQTNGEASASAQPGEEDVPAGAPKVPIDPEEFLNDPLIQKALEVFKARMLNVESST
jgi:DNA polymerase III subunit gamma/tau